MTMKLEEMDFTTKVELEPKINNSVTQNSELEFKTQCHGLVLWFETGFTTRFCKEMPTILSTSPYTAKTHWSHTILTFREPITIVSGKHRSDGTGAVGSDNCPAIKIHSRISIVRAATHRNIDISMELSASGLHGRKRSWPVQMFALS
jgi:type I protein arginine methyltransferase